MLKTRHLLTVFGSPSECTVFQSTGAHFIDFIDIKLQPDERPEDLYQRLMVFIEDNLLLRGRGSITHHGENLQEDDDDELSPSL